MNLESLEDEGRKIDPNRAIPTKSDSASSSSSTLDIVIEQLLQPNTWKPPEKQDFFCLSTQQILYICEEALKCFQNEPMLLQCRAPIKVYGDIHGQFIDLMRLFARYKSPTDAEGAGDIETMDYLFLGDYVDRGSFSLEVVGV